MFNVAPEQDEFHDDEFGDNHGNEYAMQGIGFGDDSLSGGKMADMHDRDSRARLRRSAAADDERRRRNDRNMG